MFKRDGVAIATIRTNNVKIAKENIDICKYKQYTFVPWKDRRACRKIDISMELDNCVKKTTLYKPTDDLSGVLFTICKPNIELTNETTTQAAQRLLSLNKDNVVILNFASGCNPGGSYLDGSTAQEENLCRKSGLYSCLKTKPYFYNENIECSIKGDNFYTDNIIYSPDVPFFRDEDNKLISAPYNLSVITSPAPNLRNQNEDDIDKERLLKVIKERISRILKIAALNNHKKIVLGAWGCGAFRNDPKMVAEAFKSSLSENSFFEHVCFAICSQDEDNVNLKCFKEIFK